VCLPPCVCSVIIFVRDGFCEGKCADIICEELCELAIRLGSSDNVTVVIVQFLHL